MLKSASQHGTAKCNVIAYKGHMIVQPLLYDIGPCFCFKTL